MREGLGTDGSHASASVPATVSYRRANRSHHRLTWVTDADHILVGACLVTRVALASPPPRGPSGAERDALERREREATEMFGAVLGLLRRGAPESRAFYDRKGRRASGTCKP